MSIEELKELYIKDDEHKDFATKEWSKNLFGTNINGDAFWNLGIDFISELIKLLGITKNYDKFNLKEIEKLLNNEEHIKQILSQTDIQEFKKLSNLLSLSAEVKKLLYDYIQSKITKKQSEEEQLNKLKEEENILYLPLNSNSFISENGVYYIANNILIDNLKVNKLELFDTIENGLTTINKIKEKYHNKDFKEIWAKLIIEDADDWNLKINNINELMTHLLDEVSITITSDKLTIWFNIDENEHLFGSHNPVLYLYPNRDYEFASIE